MSLRSWFKETFKTWHKASEPPKEPGVYQIKIWSGKKTLMDKPILCKWDGRFWGLWGTSEYDVRHSDTGLGNGEMFEWTEI